MKNLRAAAVVIGLLGSIAPSFGFKVGLILDRGGRDDKSFNATAFEGATRAQKDFQIELKTVEAADDNAFEPLLRSMAQKKFDLIIAVGVNQGTALKKVAPMFPDRHFAIVDSQVDAPNVRTLLFEEHQGSYLAGVAAALKSGTGKIGFVGGMDVPIIRRFQMGYEAGAKATKPGIKIESNYVGVDGSAWNNPPKAKELALQQYAKGVDVIFAPAGASATGVFDAAEEKRRFAIGVDSNQNYIKPGLILTSMMKRGDLAVYDAIKDAKDGKFVAGVTRSGVATKGVELAMDRFNEKLFTPEMNKKLAEVRAGLESGRIKAPDYYLEKAAKH